MCKKFDKKLDALFWWFIWLLPLLGALICLFMGNDNTFSDFSTFISSFSFDFIKGIIVDIQEVMQFQFPDILLSYLSYIVGVEVLHVMTDVLIFIPRFAHSLVDFDRYRSDNK